MTQLFSDIRGNRSALFFKCLNCPREFHVRKRYEKHMKECVPKFNEEEAENAMSDQGKYFGSSFL
jgi:hypothetical protein